GLVKLFEERTLVPTGAGIHLEFPIELLLRDVHDPQPEGRVGFRVIDNVVQAAPRALDLLELRSMDDFVQLNGQLVVKPRDHRFDRIENVLLDEGGVFQRLLHERGYCILDLSCGTLAPRLEALLQQVGEDLRISRFNGALRRLNYCFCRHRKSPLRYSLVAISRSSAGDSFNAAPRRSRSNRIRSGSLRRSLRRSSAATLPS